MIFLLYKLQGLTFHCVGAWMDCNEIVEELGLGYGSVLQNGWTRNLLKPHGDQQNSVYFANRRIKYFPTAAAAGAEDSSPAVQVPPYMMGQRAAWKRCAQHVYIAHFIDMQQQLNRHQSFFTGPNQVYPKSYNLNVPLAPSESLFGGAGGAPAVGMVGGASVSSSGGGAASLEATERGLNAAAMAAAAAASMQGVKERAYNMDILSRKSPGQHQHGGQQAAALPLQVIRVESVLGRPRPFLRGGRR